MNFLSSLTSIFLGALLGFIFSICLFYLTNKLYVKLQRETVSKNLIKEFEFNELYLKKLLENLKNIIEKIGTNDRDTYYYCIYKDYQRQFMQSYFQQGTHY